MVLCLDGSSILPDSTSALRSLGEVRLLTQHTSSRRLELRWTLSTLPSASTKSFNFLDLSQQCFNTMKMFQQIIFGVVGIIVLACTVIQEPNLDGKYTCIDDTLFQLDSTIFGRDTLLYCFNVDEFTYEKTGDLPCDITYGKGNYKLLDDLLILEYKDYPEKLEAKFNQTTSDTASSSYVIEVVLKSKDLNPKRDVLIVDIGDDFTRTIFDNGSVFMNLDSVQFAKIDSIKLTWGGCLEMFPMNFKALEINKTDSHNYIKIEAIFDDHYPTYISPYTDTLQISYASNNSFHLQKKPNEDESFDLRFYDSIVWDEARLKTYYLFNKHE
jgi:hypothetical protein